MFSYIARLKDMGVAVREAVGTPSKSSPPPRECVFYRIRGGGTGTSFTADGVSLRSAARIGRGARRAMKRERIARIRLRPVVLREPELFTRSPPRTTSPPIEDVDAPLRPARMPSGNA